jgi:hypothetical protein
VPTWYTPALWVAASKPLEGITTVTDEPTNLVTVQLRELRSLMETGFNALNAVSMRKTNVSTVSRAI